MKAIASCALGLLLYALLLCVQVGAQVTKPVQVYSVTEVLQWPTNFWFTNNIIRIFTNGTYLGTVQSINFTFGVTGYVAGNMAHLGFDSTYVPPVIATNYLLLETGDFFLLETGGKLMLQ